MRELVMRRPAMREAGFTYGSVLALLAILGVGWGLLGQSWEQSARREREAELLQVGGEYRRAIERYVRAGSNSYPRRLEDLLEDPRQPQRVRHLRRLHRDPITGQANWGLVRAADGGIAGVYSLSGERPLKQSGFRRAERALQGAERYSDWHFTYPPALSPPRRPE